MADTEGRSRRTAANRSSKAKDLIALAKRKREQGQQVQEEAPVYDTLDDESYAKLVAKRRQEGDFIEDDNGEYGQDLGEEEDWNRSEGSDAEQEASPAKQSKRKKTGGKAGGKDKAQAEPGAKARLQKMFAAAPAKIRHADAPAAPDKSFDAVLAEVLGDVGGSLASPARPSSYTPAPASTPGAYRRHSGAAAGRTPARHMQALHTPRTAGSATTARRPSTLSKAHVPRPQMRPLPQCPSLSPPRFDDEPAEMPDAPEEEDQQADGGTAQQNGGTAQRDGGDAAPMQADEDDDELLRCAEVAEAAAAASAATPAVACVKQESGAVHATPSTASASVTKPAAPLFADTPTGPPRPSGWDDVYEGEDNDAEAEEQQKPWNGDAALPLEGDVMQAHLIDAHEEAGHPGTVYLFCKVLAQGHWLSTCAVVPVPQRTFFVVPSPDVLGPCLEEMKQLQNAVEAEEEASPARASAEQELKLYMQRRFLAATRTELKQQLLEMGVFGLGKVAMQPRQRAYAFERPEIPHGRQWVLKVKVPAAAPTMPQDMAGDTFVAVLGGGQSSLEALLLKRRIKGPCWLRLSQPERVADASRQVSWCKLEVRLAGPKAVTALPPGGAPPPPLAVAALNLKTWLNPATGASEVVAASVVHLPAMRVDAPFPKEHWRQKRGFKHFSIVSKLDGHPFPAGFEAAVREANASLAGARNGGNMLMATPSEKALLTSLVNRLAALDADALCGHNISAFDLDVLLHRLEKHKVFQWSRIGRLKRTKFPSLKGGGHTFGGGAGAGALACIAGRLLCDTYLSARELTRQVEYTLAALAAKMLGEHREEFNSSEVASRFEKTEELFKLVHAAEADAWLALGLASVLNSLPLSAQLATVSGSLWSRVLQGQRAARIEMLLANEFYSRKFMLPDRMSFKDRAARSAGAGGDEAEDANAGGKRKAAYAGGLVLEPKKGLYDSYTLLLDFNSLYPSIIREYNICFTTVERGKEGEEPALPPPGREAAPLPVILASILSKRAEVKKLLKSERDPLRRQQFDTRQQALKLTANSMYGCLGFRGSRFFAQPLAELVTSMGRQILGATRELVEGELGLDVIYGDTDSIMVSTRSQDQDVCRQLANTIIRKVNARYSKLELALDGLYKVILLLKKKKYAAIKFETGPDGKEREVQEEKGLDQVRRDWCPLCKDSGRFALAHILSGRPAEDVVTAIHDHLRGVAEKVHARQVPLNKFVITKQLTKRPEDYPDAKNQPHVQVALRRKAAGLRNGSMQGETVPYIICINRGEGETGGAGSGKGLAARAYHIDEVRAPGAQLEVDAAYYLSQQVHPVVARLCAPIEGTDVARLADCLGLDASRFAGAAAAGGSHDAREDALVSGAAFFDDPARFKDCEALQLASASGERFPFCGVEALLAGSVDATAALQPPHAVGATAAEGLAPLSGAQLANQAVLAARGAVARYYEGELRSDDELAPGATRDVRLAAGPDGRQGSAPPADGSGSMGRAVSEAALYTQLSALHRSLDVGAALARLPKSADAAAAEARISAVRPELDAAAAAVDALRSACGHRWVTLRDICC